MRAIVTTKYGSPDVLQLNEVDKPTIKDDEVLVKVRAASVNAGDWHMLRGTPFPIRFVSGLFKPKNAIPGADFSGVIEAVGSSVTEYKPGDEVFGDLSSSGWGAFAEYVAAPADAVVLKPTGATFEEAAAAPMAGATALKGFRNQGQIQPGDKVLVIGAGGGVGTFAVQIAKSYGAEVTGVCSTDKVGMVRSIGADHVIDHSREDVTQSDNLYDFILDTAAFRASSDYLPRLSDEGVYVLVGGSTKRMIQVMFAGGGKTPAGRKRISTFLSKPNRPDLDALRALMETGKLKPAIGERYTLSELPEAMRRVEEGRAVGKAVIVMDHDD